MTIGDGHDLKSLRFAGDDVLEACYDGEHRMTIPEEGPAVAKIQQALVDLGFLLPLKGVDKKYGPETAGQVAKFKKSKAITPSDGVVGPITMGKLDEAFPPPLPPLPSPLPVLKEKWFLDVSQTGNFPPVSRYPTAETTPAGVPESKVGPSTDGNEVVVHLDGAAFMKAWHDALVHGLKSPGAELYLANWMMNNVSTLGTTRGKTDPRSNALELIGEAFTLGMTTFLLLSGHFQPGDINKAVKKDLQDFYGIDTVILDERFPGPMFMGHRLGSNHQKLCILKVPADPEFLAFIGSIDLNSSRWDTVLHLSVNLERGPVVLPHPSPGGGPYGSGAASSGPTHDLGVQVVGPAVVDLERSFRDRWRDPTLPVPKSFSTPLSPPVPSGPHSVQVLHTYGRTTKPPGYTWSPTGEFTIWAAYLKAIRAAKTYVYVEDQYFLPFGSPPHFEGPPGLQQDADIVFQLGAAITRGVKVIVVVPQDLSEEPEGYRAQVRDQRQLGVTYLAGVAKKAQAAKESGDFLIATLNNGSKPIYLHSKLLIVDDEYVNLGSANVSQRSMTHDGEVNIAVVDSEGRFAQDLRKEVWTHYLGKGVVPGLSDFTTAYPIFKAGVGASTGFLRPFVDGPKPGTDLKDVMQLVDPYAGPPPESDVVVVGGGLAGLTAARRLDQAGRSVVVLEAADHIGGRMLAKQLKTVAGQLKTVPGQCVDLGGQWVGHTQDRILALAKELGVSLFDSHHDGQTVFFWKGKRSTFKGAFPPFEGDPPAVPPKELADGKLIWKQIEDLPVGPEPWTHPDAGALDSELLSDWLSTRPSTTDFGKFVVTLMARIGGSGAFEPRNVSRLHMLFTQSVGPQKENPEEQLFFGCAGQFPERIVSKFSSRVKVFRNVPVKRIDQDATGVTVSGKSGSKEFKFRASKVVVAMPPMHAGLIDYGGTPTLPPQRVDLTKNAPMGLLIKNHAIYETPFWRDGVPALSGAAVGDLDTVQFTADSSLPTGGPGILTSFIAGDRADALSKVDPAIRKSLVLSDYVRYFGPQAAAPKEYVEMNWIEEPLIKGAFTSYMNPGIWVKDGVTLRPPVGHIHWAGTETARRWNGYFDGAVRSGEDAAIAIDAALPPAT
jgi:monoamine oxidase